MKILAYCFSDPLLEPTPDPAQWPLNWASLDGPDLELAGIYLDLATVETSPKARKRSPRSGTEELRPQWQELLQRCRSEAIDAVVVREVAELGQSVQEVSDRLAQLEALQVRVLTLAQTTAPQPNGLSDPALPPQTLHRLQTLQHQQRSQRIRQGHARNRLQALPPPGKAPYGYRRGKQGYVIDLATSPVVKEFFDQFLLYGSVRGAVRYLAKRYGKKIAPSTGQRWLSNPVYRGDLEYQDGQILRDTHPALLSRDEAAQIDRLLRRNRQIAPRAASAPRALAGLVSCAVCGSSMTITRVTQHNRSTEYLYLRPRRCTQQPKCSAIPYDEVLQATIQRICQDLAPMATGANLPDLSQARQGLQRAIAAKAELLAQLPALVDQGILDHETAALRSYKLRTEQAALENQAAQLPPVDLKATIATISIPEFWYDLSEAERRFYFREFLQAIHLLRTETGWHLNLVFFFGAAPNQPPTNG